MVKLVIMAAGMSSRYQGLKQIDKMDSRGHTLIEYSIYDAIQSGFDEVVFVIKKSFEQQFRQAVGDRIANYIKVNYVFQEQDTNLGTFKLPENRLKPWGTGHAVLACNKTVDCPFCVINCDDYYGRESFAVMKDYLSSNTDPSKWAMMGYKLKNTVNGLDPVSRGICKISDDGILQDIKELHKVRKTQYGYEFLEDEQWFTIDGDTPVSMNMWGFSPIIFDQLQSRFDKFLSSLNEQTSLTAEFSLPTTVHSIIKDKEATIKVLPATCQWFGVTYQADKQRVYEHFEKLRAEGLYPDLLFPKK